MNSEAAHMNETKARIMAGMHYFLGKNMQR